MCTDGTVAHRFALTGDAPSLVAQVMLEVNLTIYEALDSLSLPSHTLQTSAQQTVGLLADQFQVQASSNIHQRVWAFEGSPRAADLFLSAVKRPNWPISSSFSKGQISWLFCGIEQQSVSNSNETIL